MKLFEPGTIGNMQLKNRIVMAPMGVIKIAESDGDWGKKVREYYLARTQGGTGLITTGVVFVSQKMESFARHGNLNLHSDSHLESLRNIVSDAHQYGAKVSVQLSAGFGRAVAARWLHPEITPVSPSATPCYANPQRITRAITIEEAEELAQAFGSAAKRCQMAGADAVELHGHCGYLFDQFMTGLWNQREDKYGGSRGKRLTFVREAITAIRKEVGNDLAVIYRYGIDHHLKGGRTVKESLWIAKQLEIMGFDGLHVNAGCYGSTWWTHPPTYQVPGCMVDMAESVKKVVKVPVIAVGKLQYPEIAEKVLQEGKADFIGIGRGLLADPDWPKKVMAGNHKDIRPCIGDNEGCMSHARWPEMPAICTVNSSCGHEKEWSIIPLKGNKKKNLLIIGGGPAGMEAARVAAIRGFAVTLWEMAGKLGGNLWPASVPEFKKDLLELINYQVRVLHKLPVVIELNKEATADDILNFGAESVILATGALPKKPNLQGTKANTVKTAIDVLSNQTKLGQRVLVAGGGLIGCETAVYLARKDHQVILTSRRKELLTDMFAENRDMLLWMMADCKVKIVTNTQLVRIVDDGVLVNQDNNDLTISVDSLVFAGGMNSRKKLQEALTGKVPNLHAIGDCVQPRLIINAIWDAFHVARKLAA